MSTPTSKSNILWALRSHGLDESVTVTQVLENKVFAWPVNSKTGLVDHSLMIYVMLNDWPQDPNFASLHFHGTRSAVREPGGVHPALQVCFHPSPNDLYPYFVEVDLDESAPRGLRGALWHGYEVLKGRVTGRKTDQTRIFNLLCKRFGDTT